MKLKPSPRIAIAGSVNSSLQTLKKLHEHNCNVVAVLGLDPSNKERVSGYVDLKIVGDNLGYDSCYFSRINSEDVYEFLQPKDIDVFFIVGLSQLVREPLLSLASSGNVGFHPTLLPEGRGRGAVAWLVLGKAPGGVTFFLMDEGMDSGPILGQKGFQVTENDYAFDVVERIKSTIDDVLDDMLPSLKNGTLKLKEQNHRLATYLGVRKPQDGKIKWNEPAIEVRALIKATSHPLPGAFSVFNDEVVKVFRAKLRPQYTGIPGRVIDFENGKPIVCCGEGALLLTEYESANKVNLKVGVDFN